MSTPSHGMQESARPSPHTCHPKREGGQPTLEAAKEKHRESIRALSWRMPVLCILRRDRILSSLMSMGRGNGEHQNYLGDVPLGSRIWLPCQKTRRKKGCNRNRHVKFQRSEGHGENLRTLHSCIVQTRMRTF